jgi:hypothetical protein
MPEERGKGPKRAWRGGSESASKARPGGYRWKREPNDPGAARPASQHRRIVRALIALVICCATITALVLLLRPGRSPLLVLVGAGYSQNLAVPHNTWGLNTLDRLSGLTRAKNGILAVFNRSAYAPHAGPKGFPYLLTDQEGDGEKAWQEHSKLIISKAKSHKGPLILVLALHGGADATSPFLLAEEARPDSRPLRIDSVLETLGHLETAKPKILILDASAMTDAWSFGVISNDFARKLEGVKIPQGKNIWVICSCAPGQRSWVDERNGVTAFGSSLADGLAGKARASGENITLWSLSEYVGRRTRDWVAAERDAVQTPILLSDKGIVQLPTGAVLSPKKLDAAAFRKEAEGIELVRSIIAPDSAPEVPSAKALEAEDTRLDAAWSAARALERRVPGDLAKVERTPAAYAPLAWRKFRESLIRREQLRRYGYDALVARKALELRPPVELDDALKKLPEEIAQARLLALKNSRQATLAMTSAEGESAPNPDLKTQSRARDLLNGSEPEFEAKFRAEGLDRLKFAQAVILELGAVAEVDAIRAASNFLERVVPASGVNPAEIRFLSVLRTGLSDKAPPNKGLLNRAISLKSRAERLAIAANNRAEEYSYAEHVAPWVRASVDQGDRARRSGEDLLFSTHREDHERAVDLFRQAKSSYDRAEADAETVRTALALRDAVRADLPYLTHWSARRRASATPVDGLQRHPIEVLWDDVRGLGDLLEHGPTGDTARIVAAVAPVREGFAKAWQAFDDVVNGKTRDNRLDPREDFLAREVPVLDRGQFRRRDDPASNPTRNPKVNEAADRQRSAEQDRVQALLALASLGDDLFTRANKLDSSASERDKFRKRIEPEALAKALDELGPLIKTCAIWLPGHVNELARAIPPFDAPIGNEREPGLIRAERLAPLLDASQGALVTKGRDPVRMARQRRLYDLLIHQAERAWSDHDFLVEEALYPEVVKAYLADAGELGQSLLGPDWAKTNQPRLTALTKALTTIENLELVPTTREPVWTSEPSLRLKYGLSSPPVEDAPKLEGHAVAWATPMDPALTIVGDPDARMALSIGDDQSARAPFIVNLTSTDHDAKEKKPPARLERKNETLGSRLFFRGRIVPGKTPIDIHFLPELTLTADPAPDKAGLLVRADEEFGGQNSAVAIVFDNSNSMLYYSKGEDRRKYDVAVDVLDSVLREVKLKKGTWASLWIYGETPAPTIVRDFNRTQRAFSVEDWDPDKSPRELISRLVRGAGGDPPLGLWGGTPLFTTMKSALNDLESSRRERKVLIVLTDGADSITTEKQARHDIIQKEFARKGVVLDIVLFTTDKETCINRMDKLIGVIEEKDKDKAEEERKKRREHIELELKDLATTDAEAADFLGAVEQFEPKGHFFQAGARDDLKAQLTTFLAQRPYYTLTNREGREVQRGGTRKLVEHRDADISRAELLAPGDYNIGIGDAPRPLIHLNAGEILILDALSQGGKYTLQRGLVSELPATLRPFEQTAEFPLWRLSTAKGDSDRRHGASFEAALEKLSDREMHLVEKSLVIEQFTPKAVWFEIEPPLVRGAKTPFHLEVCRLADRAAPTWKFYMPDPPRGASFGDQSPRLTAWWNEERDMPGRRIAAEDLIEGKDLDGAGTILEYIGVEPHFFPGTSTAAPVDCLAIRLRHDPKKRVRIDRLELGGGTLPPEHEEHRFYSSVGRVTALYWPVKKERLPGLKAIQLAEIDAFLKGAKRLTLQVDRSLLSTGSKPGP